MVVVKWAKKPDATSNKRATSGFNEEIVALTEIKHRNIISLIGYCDDNNEEILVYKYVVNSTLDYHLHKSSKEGKSELMWNDRLGILVGAALGLYHLHYCILRGSFIHRDIKSSNILLDEDMVAQLGDFGFAKYVALDDPRSHINYTDAVQTKGYGGPYYVDYEKLTRASDTYSFGVVIFEVLSGRLADDGSRPEGERYLAAWAQGKEDDDILDSVLRKDFSEGRREALHICYD